MEKLFVPYELAVIAKEKGFDKKCLGFWTVNSGDSLIMFPLICKNKGGLISAPTHQQIMDFLREKHNIYIVVTPLEDGGYSGIIVSRIKSLNHTPVGQTTYYKALESAIEEAFKLI